MKRPALPTDKDALIAAPLERIEALLAQNAAVMAENARWAAHVAELRPHVVGRSLAWSGFTPLEAVGRPVRA